MEITFRALITTIHGMLFGGFFIMAVYALALEVLRLNYAKQPMRLSRTGHSRQRFYLWCMVGLGWAAVLTGAYIIYPWYRAVPPAGVTDFSFYPRYLLKSRATTSGWHDLGMEWKEHVAWIAPMALTMLTYVLGKYRHTIRNHPDVRRAILVFAMAALVAAGIAGFFGAMLNKYAPVNGGPAIHLTAVRQ